MGTVDEKPSGNSTNTSTANNISDPREREDFPSQLSLEADTALGSYLTVVSVLTIVLNLIVIVTVARRKRTCSPLEMYVVSLAVGDFTVAVLAYPASIWAAFHHTWDLGLTACKAYAATVYFFGISSISILGWMSVMRYLKTHHVSADQYIGKRLVCMSLAGLYIYSATWAVAPLLGWGSYAAEPFGLTCTLDWRNLSVSYVVCIFLLAFFLPILCMAFSYGSMVHQVFHSQKKMQNVSNKMDVYLTKMTILMCGGFLLAWTPYAVVTLCYISDKYDSVPLPLAASAPFFAKSSTVYTPIIYFLVIKRFREDIKEVFFPGFVKQEEQRKTLFMYAEDSDLEKSSLDTQEKLKVRNSKRDESHINNGMDNQKDSSIHIHMAEIIPLTACDHENELDNAGEE